MRCQEVTISYRLSEPYLGIVRRCATEHKLSPSQFARLALVQQLEDTAILKLKDEVNELRQELGRLRQDFNCAVDR